MDPELGRARANILVGTSGFRYEEWRGSFYPAELKSRDMLSYYSQRFPVVELDFSYYRMPDVRTIKGLEGNTPSGFRFCVKAHRSMTHEIGSPGETKAAFGVFMEAMLPLIETNKLGCILMQFPWRFRPGPGSLEYLSFARTLLDAPVVVEFRNREWVSEDTFRFLQSQLLGYCCVDEPKLRGLMPSVARFTVSPAYVRFHGRNAAKWWKHEHPSERYDYLYSKEELEEWIPKVGSLASLATEVYVLFNNCHGGSAARNALDFKALLAAGRP